MYECILVRTGGGAFLVIQCFCKKKEKSNNNTANNNTNSTNKNNIKSTKD